MSAPAACAGEMGVEIIDEHPGHVRARGFLWPLPVELEDHQGAVPDQELDPGVLHIPVLVRVLGR